MLGSGDEPDPIDIRCHKKRLSIETKILYNECTPTTQKGRLYAHDKLYLKTS